MAGRGAKTGSAARLNQTVREHQMDDAYNRLRAFLKREMTIPNAEQVRLQVRLSLQTVLAECEKWSGEEWNMPSNAVLTAVRGKKTVSRSVTERNLRALARAREEEMEKASERGPTSTPTNTGFMGTDATRAENDGIQAW